MRYYDTSFFCEDDQPIYSHISIWDGGSWPITLTINTSIDKPTDKPTITLHLSSLAQLIAFKNSVVSSVDRAISKKHSIKRNDPWFDISELDGTG